MIKLVIVLCLAATPGGSCTPLEATVVPANADGFTDVPTCETAGQVIGADLATNPLVSTIQTFCL
jgi:hypothetical protein